METGSNIEESENGLSSPRIVEVHSEKEEQNENR